MKTKVIFRIWPKSKGGDVIALFPQHAATAGKPEHCLSYQHIGQHGGADLFGLTCDLRLATPEEYADLKSELESLGYSLRVCKRTNETDRMMRERELALSLREAEAESQEQETAEERRERIEADKADAWHDQAVDREAWRNE